MKTWQHAANEWADATCNALQWMRNVRDGISTPDEAIAAIESDIRHSRDSQPDVTGKETPDLSPVIAWLENGCDPKEAAKELRIYQQRMRPNVK